MIDMRVERAEAFMNSYRVYLRDTNGGRHAFAAPITLQEVEPGMLVDPMLTLSPETAQGLIDELWRAGLRPSEGSGSAGSLAATERHLKDMRALLAHSTGATL